jgi:hypothetical protein
MLILVMPFLFSLSSRFRVTDKSFKSMAAVNLAEAGVERAIWELNSGHIALWSGSVLSRTLTLTGITTPDGQTAGDIVIEVQNPASDFPVVITTGRVPLGNGVIFERRLRVKLKHRFRSFFDFGIFTDEGFDLYGNGYTDSYNSNDGPYDPTYRHYLGNIGTNADNRWDVVLLNNTIIYGDCATGFESDPAQVIRLRNAATITGDQYALDDVKPMPDITPPFLTSMGAYATGVGATTTITGSAEFSSFTLASNSKVTISGDVKIYVNGPFTMGSNSILEITPGSNVEFYLGNGAFNQASNCQVNNLTLDPKRLAFLGTSSFTTMNWRANSQFYGVVYAPQAAVDFSANADVFGSLVCNTLSLSAMAGIHFDESLVDWEKFGTVDPRYRVKDWQEY